MATMSKHMVVSQIRGTLFRGPYNKDYSILGSILGSPYFGKLPYHVKLQRARSSLIKGSACARVAPHIRVFVRISASRAGICRRGFPKP